jgi:predicted MarR family transcription regulator
MILFRLQPDGFRAADLRQHLAALSGKNPGDISQGAVTYQLRRLRLHGIIERKPKSFRYQITTAGVRAAIFFTRVYNRLLRPGLACALPDHHAIDGLLKRAFDKIETALAVWLQQLKLAV